MSSESPAVRTRRAVSTVGLVVHPTRNIDMPMAGLCAWADEHEVSVVRKAEAAGRPRLYSHEGPRRRRASAALVPAAPAGPRA